MEGAAGEAGVEGAWLTASLILEGGEQAGGAVRIFRIFREESVHVEPVGEFVEERFALRLAENNDVRSGEADDFGERVNAAFALLRGCCRRVVSRGKGIGVAGAVQRRRGKAFNES